MVVVVYEVLLAVVGVGGGHNVGVGAVDLQGVLRVCIRVCVYVCVYTCVFMCVCIRVYLCVCVCICVYTCVYRQLVAQAAQHLIEQGTHKR